MNTDSIEQAIEQLYRLHYQPVLRHLQRLVGQHESAEDLCQETFLKVFKHWHQLRDTTCVRGWLFQIATNTAIDFLRRQRRIRGVTLCVVNQKLRIAIENVGRVARVEGLWWQYSLTERTQKEPSAVSLLSISRDRDGVLEVAGRSWQENGSLSARYWSEAVKERKETSSVFYYWKGERPMDPNAPQLDGIGEIRLESADRASGFFTTRADTRGKLNARTAGVYWRANPEDLSILDGRDDQRRAELIAERLSQWKSLTKPELSTHEA